MLARSESKCRLTRNIMNFEEKEVRHQQRRSTWCGVQGGQGECWCWWRSAECNWGEQSRAKESRWGLWSAYPVEQPSMLSIAECGRIFRVWNEIEVLQIEVGEGIEQCQREWRSTYSTIGAPLGGGGGGGGGMFRIRNEIERLQIGVGAGIEARRMKYRSANPDWAAPILA